MEKLILALKHPEKETPIRVAWLLGQLKDARAVPELINLIKTSEDVYLAREAVTALGEIDTSEAREFLSTIRGHPAKMVRDEVQKILSRVSAERPSDEERRCYES